MIKINHLFFITFTVLSFSVELHSVVVLVIVNHLLENISVGHPDTIQI